MAFDFFKIIIPFVAGVAVTAVGGPVGAAIFAGAVSGGAYAATQDEDILEGAMIGAAAGYGGSVTAGAMGLGAAETGAGVSLAETTPLAAKVGIPATEGAVTPVTTPTGAVLGGEVTPAAKGGFLAAMEKHPTLTLATTQAVAGAAGSYGTAISAEKLAEAEKEAARETRKPVVTEVPSLPSLTANITIPWEERIKPILGYQGKKGVLA